MRLACEFLRDFFSKGKMVEVNTDCYQFSSDSLSTVFFDFYSFKTV